MRTTSDDLSLVEGPFGARKDQAFSVHTKVLLNCEHRLAAKQGIESLRSVPGPIESLANSQPDQQTILPSRLHPDGLIEHAKIETLISSESSLFCGLD